MTTVLNGSTVAAVDLRRHISEAALPQGAGMHSGVRVQGKSQVLLNRFRQEFIIEYSHCYHILNGFYTR